MSEIGECCVLCRCGIPSSRGSFDWFRNGIPFGRVDILKTSFNSCEKSILTADYCVFHCSVFGQKNVPQIRKCTCRYAFESNLWWKAILLIHWIYFPMECCRLNERGCTSVNFLSTLKSPRTGSVLLIKTKSYANILK